MRSSHKLLIGVFSHLPAIYMAFFMGFIIYMMTHEFQHNGSPEVMPTSFVILFICHMFFMLLVLALLAFWIYWLVKNPNIPQESKIIWSLGCFFAAPAVMPILYWVYLRKSPDSPVTPRTAT